MFCEFDFLQQFEVRVFSICHAIQIDQQSDTTYVTYIVEGETEFITSVIQK